MLCVGRFPHDGKRTTLADANIAEGTQLIRIDRHHIALLGFVAPNLERAHAFFVARHIAELEIAPTATVFYKFREGITQTTRTHIVNKGNGVIRATLPAAIDDFLAATLNLWVLALHRGEVQVFGTRSTGHGRRRTAAQPNEHRRTT